MSEQLSVVKLGGSLLDMPGVWTKLRAWLDALPGRQILIIGGGGIVDELRKLDQIHAINPERAHWLAIGAMKITADLAQSLLPRSCLVTQLTSCSAMCLDGTTPILDPWRYLVSEGGPNNPLPHSWEATSDSIAARVAREASATHLYVLKSCPVDHYKTWDEFAAAGIVDKRFPREAASLTATEIILVNFRDLP
jgi:aspartokinase-like uncharacterized kinase